MGAPGPLTPAAARREPVRLPFGLERSGALTALAGLAVAAVAGAMTAFSPMLGVAAVLAAAGAVVLAVRPAVAVFCLVAIVPAVSGISRGIPVPGFRIAELLLSGTSVVLLLTSRRSVRWRSLDWLACAYAATTLVLGLVGLAKRGAPLSSDDLGAMTGPLQFVLLYRAIAVSTVDPDLRQRALRWMLWSSVPVALLAIGQAARIHALSGWLAELTGATGAASVADAGPLGRITGPFEHWHALAGFLTIVVLCAVSQLLAGARRGPLLVILLLDVIALILSVRIAPLMLAVLGSLALGLWYGRGRQVGIAAIAGLVVAAIAFQPLVDARVQQQYAATPTRDYPAWVPQTLAYRYDLWVTRGPPTMHGRWSIGYGPDLPPEFERFPFTESLYIALLLRGGLVLLIVYGCLIAAMLALGRRIGRVGLGQDVVIGRAFAVVVAGFVALNLIEAYFIGSGVPHLTWALAGLCAAARASSET